jgi:hypothetical protein
LNAVNIVHAKQIFNSAQFHAGNVEFYLKKVIDFWGYEFFQGEHNYPMSCGGWFQPSVFGVRTDLLYVPNYPSEELFGASEASKLSTVRVKR